MRKLIVGNWKMNGSRNLLETFGDGFGFEKAINAEIVICPPNLYLAEAVAKSSNFAVGAQDCSFRNSGAFTGDVSADMLQEVGATYTIVGHSERRQYHRETSDVAAAKAKSIQQAGIVPIYCIGESRSEYENQLTYDVLINQLSSLIVHGVEFQNLVVAYEPVWSIGTGHVPDLETIGKVMADIDDWILSNTIVGTKNDVRYLYGGSVSSKNAAEILTLPNVDGVLVGGASLKAAEVSAIANSVS